MHDLIALAYLSNASELFDEPALESLLASARARNATLGVTGALLYHDGTFFQYIEGPQAGVDDVWQRIRTSPGHFGLIELVRRPIAQRHFDRWHMGFVRAPRSVLLQLSQAAWLDEASSRSTQPATPAGLKLLLDFWERSQRR